MKIKKEYSNGLFDVLEIYDEKFKILEKTNGVLWNATEENPITIAKSRQGDYVVSDVELDIKLEEEKEEENKQEN